MVKTVALRAIIKEIITEAKVETIDLVAITNSALEMENSAVALTNLKVVNKILLW